MAANTSIPTLDPQAIRAAAAMANAVPSADAPGVDKIRELLFGNQMQDYDRRFSLLEDRFLQKLRDQEGELARNLGSVESLIKKQMESIAGQVRQEQDLRAEADKELGRALREQIQGLEKRLEPTVRSDGRHRARVHGALGRRVALVARRNAPPERRRALDDRAHVFRAQQRQDRPQPARRLVRRDRPVPESGHGAAGQRPLNILRDSCGTHRAGGKSPRSSERGRQFASSRGGELGARGQPTGSGPDEAARRSPFGGRA